MKNLSIFTLVPSAYLTSTLSHSGDNRISYQSPYQEVFVASKISCGHAEIQSNLSLVNKLISEDKNSLRLKMCAQLTLLTQLAGELANLVGDQLDTCLDPESPNRSGLLQAKDDLYRSNSND